MGKRKLKFDVRKNCERKAAICLDAKGACDVKDSSDANSEEKLLVITPLSAYISSPAPDLYLLQERLLKSKKLPTEWACSGASPAASQLVLSTVRSIAADADHVHVLPCIVNIEADISWTASIGQSNINKDSLIGIPHSLCSVERTA